MKIETIVTTLEKVPEALHEYYVQKDDKFELQMEGAKTQGDVDRLSVALTKERGEHKINKNKLSAWGDLDPTETLTLLGTVPEMQQQIEDSGGKKTDEQIELILKGRMDPVKHSLKQAMDSLAERDAEVAGFRTANDNRLIMDQIRGMASSSEANKKSYETNKSGLMLTTLGLFEIVEGKVVAREDSGLTMGHTPKEALADIQNMHPYYWATPSGGGATPNTGGNGATNVFKQNNMTKRAELNHRDPAEYARQHQASGLGHGEKYTE